MLEELLGSSVELLEYSPALQANAVSGRELRLLERTSLKQSRIANFPLVKASSLDLQHSQRRLRTDLSLLVVEERPFCRGKRKRSFYTEITSREFNATEKHAARIAQKQ